MIAAKGVDIGNANGTIKAAKGVPNNKKTGSDQADIKMVMKFLGNEQLETDKYMIIDW
jgi:hypothetical protein